VTTCSDNSDITLRLCSICENADFDRDSGLIRQALNEAGLQGRVRVTQAACLGACESPSVLSLQGQGKATFVFSGVDLAQDAMDVARTCQTYLEAHKGWIKDARPCGRLRHKLRAKVPTLDD
jgi:predicted metal-binding protein